jgi:hypothetical protein
MNEPLIADGPITLMLNSDGTFRVWSEMTDQGVHLEIVDIAVLARIVRDRSADVDALSAILGDEQLVRQSLQRLRQTGLLFGR